MERTFGLSQIIDYLVYPALAGLCTISWIVFRNFGLDVLPSAILVLIVLRIVVFAMELIYPRNNISILRDRTILNDLGYYAIRLFTGRYVSAFGVIFLYQASGKAVFDIWPHESHILVQAALFFVLYELGNYFVHRLEHNVPFLWWIHSIHHAPRTMHHFRKDKDHFLHVISLYLFIIFPLMAIGAPSSLFIVFILWEGANSTIKHSNMRHKLPNWLHYLVPSADLHHIHHSCDLAQGNSNYANFPLIDVIFGTFTPPSTKIPGYGVPEDDVPHAFFSSLAHPFRAMARSLKPNRTQSAAVRTGVDSD